MSEVRLAALQERFQAFAGVEGRVAFAPGRVNLIGEHTDYTGGFVLPAGLSIGTWTLAAPRTDDSIRVHSENQNETVSFPLETAPAEVRGHWSDYVAGVAWALQRSGRRLRGADLLLSSTVPLGSGLSSSAALEVSVAHALLGIAGLDVPPLEIAQQCQIAENEFVGARCGIMDQFVATHGRSDQALLLDCETLSWQPVPLAPSHRWIVANTMVRHELASGEYNIRRAECEQIVRLASRRFPNRTRLANLTPDEAERLGRDLTPQLANRLRHLVSENRRVLATVEALEKQDFPAVGRFLNASHASLRMDFQVSCAELDLMVDLALGLRGTLGARMIGGGFGGCTLTLVAAEHAEAVVHQLRDAYASRTGKQPLVSVCKFGGAGARTT